MKTLTETLAKKHSTPNQTYYRGFTISPIRTGAVTYRVATRGGYQITKSSYQSVLDSIRRKYYSCRRDLRNMYAGCASCNCYGLQDHNAAITARVIKQHGQEVWDEMRDNRSMAKPDHIEIKRIHESLREQHSKVFGK